MLLLDLDDTILDNRSGVGAAWDAVAELLADARPGVDAARWREGIHRATRWFWADPARHRTGRLDLLAARREILGRVLADEGVADAALVERAARFYQEHRDATLRLEAGVLEVLAALRRAVPRLGLVTNGAAQVQRAKVERFRLARFFDHVQIEGEFGAGKPDRVVFEHAVRVLEGRPEETLMVGDNFECDVMGPLDAGLHAAWIDAQRVGKPPAEAPRAFLRLRALAELPGLIGG